MSPYTSPHLLEPAAHSGIPMVKGGQRHSPRGHCEHNTGGGRHKAPSVRVNECKPWVPHTRHGNSPYICPAGRKHLPITWVSSFLLRQTAGSLLLSTPTPSLNQQPPTSFPRGLTTRTLTWLLLHPGGTGHTPHGPNSGWGLCLSDYTTWSLLLHRCTHSRGL